MVKHHLLVGTWTPPGAIFTFQFDDETLELTLIKRTPIPEDEPISWLTIDHEKKALYGAAMKKWSSFTIKSPTEIEHHSSHPLGDDPQANSLTTKTRAIFVLAAHKPPYNVYGNPFYEHAGHGNVFSVDAASGGLAANIQNYAYSPQTAIHGMAFDDAEEFLYSADMWANKVWCHRKDARTGQVELVGSAAAPKEKDAPRWVALRKGGEFLLVLNEHGNTLAEYKLDEQRVPVFTGRTWPLVPDYLLQKHPHAYRADVVTISHSGKYAFATSRSNHATLTGYISAFSLRDDGSVDRQMLLHPTPTSGGHSNAVAPCDWSDEWLALTDDEKGWLEVYRWDGEKGQLARVAHCDVREPGFGMNAVWYD